MVPDDARTHTRGMRTISTVYANERRRRRLDTHIAHASEKREEKSETLDPLSMYIHVHTSLFL